MSLAIKNLSFDREQICVFEKINFTLTPGSLLQIVGANGSGKTTLLRLLAGFLLPTEGEICWQEKSILSQRSAFQDHVIYLGHQNGLKAFLTVNENIKLMCALESQTITQSFLDTLLKNVGLLALADSLIKNLSAGQQRRLSYLRLFLFPKLLWILDEPITAVDQEGQGIFTDMLQSHLSRGGIAVVATHQLLKDNLATYTLRLGATSKTEALLC